MARFPRPRPEDPLERALFDDPQQPGVPTSPDPQYNPLERALFGDEPQAVQPAPISQGTQPTAPTSRRATLPGQEPIGRPSVGGELVEGVSEGLSRLRTDVIAGAGVVSQAFGAEETAEELLNLAASRTVEASKTAAPRVEFDNAFDNPSNFVHWLARITGESVPVMAAAVLGGGVGGIAARLALRGAGGAATAAAVNYATRIGQAVGGTATVAGTHGIGAVGGEQFMATGRVDPASAIVGGVAIGALESVTPILLGRAAGVLGNRADDFVRAVGQRVATLASRPSRAVGAAARVGVTEGATELFQEAIQIEARRFVDENYETLGEEGRARLLEAAASGFFMGGAFGGALGAFSEQAQQQTPLTDTTTEPISEGGPPIGLLPPPGGAAIPPRPGPPEPSPEPGLPEIPGIELPENLLLPSPQRSVAPELPNVPVTQGIATAAVTGEGPTRFSADPDTFLAPEGPVTALSAEAFSRADISAGIRELPQKISLLDERVEFLEDSTRDQAMTAARSAIRARESAYSKGDIAPEALARAEELYDKALQLGFRYRTQSTSNFRLASLEGLQESDLVTVPFNPTTLPDAIGGLRVLGSSLDLKSDGGSVELGSYVRPDPVDRLYQVDIDAALTHEELTIGDPDFIRFALYDYAEAISPELAREMRRASYGNQVEGDRPLDEIVDQLLSAAEGLIKPGRHGRKLLVKILQSGDTSGEPLTVSPQRVARAINQGFYIRPTADNLTYPSILRLKARRRGKTSALPRSVTEIPAQPSERRRVPLYFGRHDDAFIGYLREGPTNMLGRVGRSQIKTLEDIVDVFAENNASVLIHKTDEYHSSKEVQKFANEAKRVVEDLVKQFKLNDFGIILQFSSEADSAGYMYGTQVDQYDKLVILNVNSEAAGRKKKGRAWEILTHEFGHMLGITEFARTPRSMQLELLSAYNRDLVRALHNPGGLGASRFLSPSRMMRLTRKLVIEASRVTESAEVNPNSLLLDFNANVAEGFGGDHDYYMGFDEWFADKTVNYVLEKAQQETSILSSIFRSLGRKLVHLFGYMKKLGLYGADFSTGESFRRYMEYLQNRDPSRGPEAMQQIVANPAISPDGFVHHNAVPEGIERTGQTARTDRFADKAVKELKIKREEVDLHGLRDLGDYFNGVVKRGWNILQLADKNPGIKWLQQYVTEAERWYAKKMNWMARANERTRQWLALGKVQSENLAKLIFDVDQMVYLKEGEANRHPTDEELTNLARKHKLSQEAFDMFRSVRTDFLDLLNEIERVTIRDTVRQFGKDNPILLFEIPKIQKEFAALRARPYFPHSRFGDFVVVVKDSEGKTVFMEQFANRREARRNYSRVLAEAKRMNPGAELSGWVDKLPEEVQVFRGLPPSLLKLIRARLNLSEEQRDWLDHLIVDMAPSQSFRKRLAKRENVPGFSRDALRSYSDYFWHAANHVARIDHGETMRRILSDAKGETTELGKAGYDVSKRREISDFAALHLEQLLNPQPDWAQLRSFAFQWWLGYVPASAFLNLTQVPIVTYPYLAARFSDVSAVKAIGNAYTQIRKMYTDPEKARARMTDADFKLLDLAMQQGFIDESMAMELAAVAEGSNLTRLRQGTQFQRGLMQFAHLSGLMFQAAEKVNRRVTFRAGVELARRNPDAKYLAELRQQRNEEYVDLLATQRLSPQEAMAFLAGKDAVKRTQYEYAAYARPQFMQGKKGVIFTFFMFLQNSLWFALYSPGNTRYLLMMFLAAGMMGLPGAEDAVALAKFMARQFDKEFDVEKELRTMIVDNFGDTFLADAFLHGAGRFGFGLPAAADAVGLPLPEFDMSTSIGLGQIIPGVSALGPAGLDFNERFSQVTTDVAGASLGVAINLFRFLGDTQLPIDDAKRYERAMPRALRNVFRATRFGTEGQERTRTGAKLLDFDVNDPEHLMEIAQVALGFQPTRLARRWDRTIAQRDQEAFWAARRTMLLSQYDHAVRVGDKEARADALAAIVRFNKTTPFPSIAISRKTIKRSLESRERRRQEVEAGLGRSRIYDPIAQETKRIYPLDQEPPKVTNPPEIK